MTTHGAILERVSRYYGERIRRNGPTAAGADWKSSEQQSLRFEQLLKIVEPGRAFSINDYGCGYGALVNHLRLARHGFEYRGFDICEDMLREARRQHGSAADCRFFGEEKLVPPADYTVSSGIFNVKGVAPVEVWTRYVLDVVDRMAALSTRGFAFNVLTRFVDFERSDLFYADPFTLAEHCMSRYSKRVALLHDYGLYEFTLLVRM